MPTRSDPDSCTTRPSLVALKSESVILVRCLLPAISVVTGQRLWRDVVGLDWTGARSAHVDLAGVESADTTLVAVLIGMARQARPHGVALSVTRSTAAVDSLLAVHSLSIPELNRLFSHSLVIAAATPTCDHTRGRISTPGDSPARRWAPG